ncbi:type VI secretion system baseplate subunit TssK [Roseinatronobacter monicus]|uniref:Type VI secretion system protein ImpJ n=1 Tax=Roseinatronobacter monicus TaxID=393481 RepID=A0A543K4G1_9RHOB|nr:type VI secretion system baseplate subunit TssK [Roseinatronobacter monicus]TQM89969.1 type VI secretion system protein ImpJ [Roseinatronobacter monicus]
MSARNKIVWSNGLFVKPHHFQQQTRYFEQLVNRTALGAEPHFYGFTSVVLNEDLCALGKVELRQASGIMPDGTVFDFPSEDIPPPILDVSEGFIANQLIYLCVPLSSDGGVEVQDGGGEAATTARYEMLEHMARDNSVQAGELAALKVARLRPVLALESKDLSGYVKLSVGRIIEKGDDGALKIEEHFVPTMLHLAAAPKLFKQLYELASGVENRAKVIARRVGKPDQSGISSVTDFMLLQLLNRLTPQLRHFARHSALHPRAVFEALIGMVGDLATFMTEERLCPELPAYNHDRPDQCWPAVLDLLRRLITRSLETSADFIKLEPKKHGYFLAPIAVPDLIKECDFVLAVRAAVPQERLQRDFTAQSKVASIGRIRELVAKQLPGLPLRLLPVAPRQLPYHAGYSYFAVDRNTPEWRQMERAEGFAFHVAGDFPGLEMQFWAIKP